MFCLILVSSLNYYLALAADSDSSVSTLTVGINVDFSASPTSGTAPLTVQFTDQSNADSGANYSWQFGDGGTSTEQNPSYTYTQDGSYSVTLSIDDGITSDSLTRFNYITVDPEGGAGPFKPSPPVPTPPFITEVSISPQEYSVDISWQTREPASTELEWGKTQDYEQGRVSAREQDLTYGHRIIISDLDSDTVYYFRIIARTQNDYTVFSKGYSFKTLYIDLEPPANISNFEAIPGDQRIGLQWKNPQDSDFAGVKIVRSQDFFPLSPDQGVEIYNGKKEFFLDTELKNGKRYYYTGFAYDKSGNYSSGAITTAFPWQKDKPMRPGDIPPIIPPDLPLPPLPPDFPPLPPQEPGEPTPPLLEELTFPDVEFYQAGKRIYSDSQHRVKLTGNTPFVVLIKAEKLPQALKTIIVSLTAPEESQDRLASLSPESAGQKSASYLLKINQDKTAYQTTINPPNYPGEYQAQITILNYQDGSLKELKGKIIIRQPISILGFYNIPSIYALIILLIITVLTISAAYYISQRRKKKKEQSYGEKVLTN